MCSYYISIALSLIHCLLSLQCTVNSKQPPPSPCATPILLPESAEASPFPFSYFVPDIPRPCICILLVVIARKTAAGAYALYPHTHNDIYYRCQLISRYVLEHLLACERK